LGKETQGFFVGMKGRTAVNRKGVARIIVCDECGNKFHPKELFCTTCHTFEKLNQVKWVRGKRTRMNDSDDCKELLKMEVQN
jgi:ribosomal protein L37E